MSTRIGRYRNPAMNLHWGSDGPPNGSCETALLPTPDHSATGGTLYLPSAPTSDVVALSHPRVDMTSHYLIPHLVATGYAVWAQRTRTINNDLTAVHEELLIDLAVAHSFLRERGFERLVLVGNSGGASLYCFYLQQALRDAKDRIGNTPSGRPVDLSLEMLPADALVLLAPHPGQGDLLRHCIDPSLTDEHDGDSVDPALSLFEPRNGFREPPEPSSFDAEFLACYRQAQLERVRRIDAIARDLLADRAQLRAESKRSGSVAARRAALTPAFMTVYRTDADPRAIDLSLDPSERDYGSIFSRRPDLTNYGAVGFGRLTTPEAWLSTWSSESSRAAIRHCGPEITRPVLTIAYSADNSVYPSQTLELFAAFGSQQKELTTVRGDHYGYGPGNQERTGGREAAALIIDWLKANL